jgi:hypothetical protein
MKTRPISIGVALCACCTVVKVVGPIEGRNDAVDENDNEDGEFEDGRSAL